MSETLPNFIDHGDRMLCIYRKMVHVKGDALQWPQLGWGEALCGVLKIGVGPGQDCIAKLDSWIVSIYCIYFDKDVQKVMVTIFFTSILPFQ